MSPPPPRLQRRVAAREEESLARERATLGHVREMEARLAALDERERKTRRVRAGGGQGGLWV